MSHQSLIFIHGNSSSKTSFNALEALSSPYATTYSFELPGHGAAERLADYSWKQIKINTLEKINEVSGKKMIFGHSYGGHLLIELAKEIEDLTHIIISGTPPLKLPFNMEEAFLPNPALNLFFDENPTRKDVSDVMSGLVSNQELVPFLVDDFFATDSQFRLDFAKSLQNPIDFLNQYQLFKELSCSKLILHGSEDPVVNYDYLKQLVKEGIPLELIDKCGHYPHLERPESVWGIIKSLIKK